MSPGLAHDQPDGSILSSRSMVSAVKVAGTPPSSASRSVARMPSPPPLVRIASRLPRGTKPRPSSLAQSNIWRRS
jgi:hypothetical protein